MGRATRGRRAQAPREPAEGRRVGSLALEQSERFPLTYGGHTSGPEYTLRPCPWVSTRRRRPADTSAASDWARDMNIPPRAPSFVPTPADSAPCSAGALHHTVRACGRAGGI